MLLKIMKEIYVDIIYLIIGITAVIILFDQTTILGIDVLSTENTRPYAYAKQEHNLINFLIFLVIAISGIFFGLSGLLKTLKRKNQEQQKDNIKSG